MYAVWIDKTGGPEVLSYREGNRPVPSEGEVLVKISAVGVNFIDVYYRTGLYPGDLPFIPGMEAAGVVVAVGPKATEYKVDDRVAYVSHLGSYAEYAAVPESKLVPVPDDVGDQTAAAALLQGMTAHYLTHSTYPIQAGDAVLIHAAAGGIGSLLVQVARNLGAYIIGTVSTEEKAMLAREAGVNEVIRYTEEDFEDEVLRLTHGEGVAVVYDNVGKTTFEKSLNCLRKRGYMILYGQSSGSVSPIDPARLGKKSLFLTRPYLFDYIDEKELLRARARDVLNWIRAGKLRLRIWATYPLAEAAQAHQILESRASAGKLLLRPD